MKENVVEEILQLILKNQKFFCNLSFLTLFCWMYFLFYCFIKATKLWKDDELPNCQDMMWLLCGNISLFYFRTMNWMGLIRQELILKTIRSAWMFLRRYFNVFILRIIYVPPFCIRSSSEFAQVLLIWLYFVCFLILRTWVLY